MSVRVQPRLLIAFAAVTLLWPASAFAKRKSPRPVPPVIWEGVEYRAPLEKQKQRLAEVAAFMNNDRGPLIYSDNVSLMLATSKSLFTTDPFTQTHATHYGRWDQSKLLALTRSGQFSLIVLRQPIEGDRDIGDRRKGP